MTSQPARRSAAGPDAVPAWFRDALEAPVTQGRVHVTGAEVRFRTWGTRTALPGLVLIHGGAAHSRWWDHIAPLLATDRKVAALDLTGHGDSGRRDRYSLDQWAAEVWATAAAADLGPRPFLLGHSMGGFVAVRTAAQPGTELAGLVIVDSPLRDVTPEEEAARSARAFGPLRRYPTRAAAVARFRPVPDQSDNLDFVMAHIATNSVREVTGGWSWKFDPAIFARHGRPFPADTKPRCRIAFLRAEHGMVTVEMQRNIVDHLGPDVHMTEIPDASHHIMLDRPLALVSAARRVLTTTPL